GLRHVQGPRQKHGADRHHASGENRRKKRRLPSRPCAEVYQEARPMTPTGGAKSVRLLVADDNPLVRDLIDKGMEPYCDVILAPDGADALLQVIYEPPDP